MSGVLVNETQLIFPSHTVVTASAGAGKTYTLSWRFVQFLLGSAIHKNGLRNLLAITFTRNAAAEMKQRILLHLKRIVLGDPDSLAQIRMLVEGDEDAIRKRAQQTIDHILWNYSDFQVQTIDSFLERIFVSSSIDLKLPPDVQVELSSTRLFTDAFREYTKSIREEGDQLKELDDIIRSYDYIRSDSATYLWKPDSFLLERSRELHDYLVTLDRPVTRYNADEELTRINNAFVDELRVLKSKVLGTGFDFKHHFARLCEGVERSGITAALGKKSIATPVNKGKHSSEEYESVMLLLEPHVAVLMNLQVQYYIALARGSYEPALRALGIIGNILDEIKWNEARVFIHDVSSSLHSYIRKQNIPEVYFRLGEQITHFFIDEFQDTSPVQWAIIYPLIEHALAQAGSLFVVGDPKQSIYGYRGADWRIMMELAEDKGIFPSSFHVPETLPKNYRSGEAIIRYAEDVFQQRLEDDNAEAARMSGLDSFTQEPKQENKDKGYVELVTIPYLETDDEQQSLTPEAERIVDIIQDCTSDARGYSLSDIGILASKNAEVVSCGNWLNEKGIPFISHSNLDIRQRKTVGELFALLTFLDSPINNFAFSIFIQGQVLTKWISNNADITQEQIQGFILRYSQSKSGMPMYTAFRDEFPQVFEDAFEPLLNVVGYLPVYELLTIAYSTFALFDMFSDEESALVKLLETALEAGDTGITSIESFLQLKDDESESELWSMNVPATLDAVQVMTVHKAKGLEFPVVIVLLYDQDPKSAGYYLRESDDSYELLRLTKTFAEATQQFSDIYKEQKQRERADALNRVYVAFTRPEMELYVVSVEGKRSTFPSVILQNGGSQLGAKQQAKVSEKQTPEKVQLALTTTSVLQGIDEHRESAHDDTTRGDAIHKALASIEIIEDDAELQVKRALESIAHSIPSDIDIHALQQDIYRYITSDQFYSLFHPSDIDKVFTEKEIVDANGNLYRVDRMLVGEATVTVIDYKTGARLNVSSHSDQLRKYLRIIMELYPDREVVGILAYLDAESIMEVRL